MKCKVCEETNESLFYSGVKTYCKEHWKQKVKKHREDNKEHYKEYDKARGMRPDRVEMREKYQQTDAGKEAVKRAKDKWRNQNPSKRAAHIILGNAVRDGKVIKPESCSMCGSKGKIHGHHEDYCYPLIVKWVCSSCHSKIHSSEVIA